ncbi:MAG: methyltransferase domain-containing protein [Bacteroidia bacterium]|nr:methyltransferase domain-containing protein [Bacteroidia bacterium]
MINWQTYWDKIARSSEDPHAQVARIQGKTPLTEKQLRRIALHIVGQLDLRPHYTLLDVCCGNGTLTRLLAEKCSTTTGVDISPEQIRRAKTHSKALSITYQVADATQLTSHVEGTFDRINLYFSFQYLDSYSKGRAAIREMAKLLKPGGKIFIGDVPDAAKLPVFYPSLIARIRYKISHLLGRHPMGKFWKEAEIQKICREVGLSCVTLAQPGDLPYAVYRVDYVIF